jgi:hypothetical protein
VHDVWYKPWRAKELTENLTHLYDCPRKMVHHCTVKDCDQMTDALNELIIIVEYKAHVRPSQGGG